MSDIKIVINSNRDFQRGLEKELKEKHPDLKPIIVVQKGWDTFQITEIVLTGIELALEIISLVHILRKQKANSKIKIEIEYRGKKLKIDAENQNIDINKIIEDFSRDIN